jgi:hypothetical protein
VRRERKGTAAIHTNYVESVNTILSVVCYFSVVEVNYPSYRSALIFVCWRVEIDGGKGEVMYLDH